MPDVSKFTVATSLNSGVVDAHIAGVHAVCQRENAFLFVRPSETATMRLIKAGFATKSMDVHDKSSDWGITSGFVPCDQAFNKKRVLKPDPDIKPHAHGEAEPVHLQFQGGTFTMLQAGRHFPDLNEFSSCSRKRPNTGHYHSTKNKDVCFDVDRQGKASWMWRNKPGKAVPLWVWAYKGVPVTGDYDMWMVAPHVSVAPSTEIFSVKDQHGRSAASQFTTQLMVKLNQGCGRAAKPVFNHGAEAQNFSFTQAMDKRLAVFPPGQMKPFVITRILLPGILHDILRHGYMAVRNPKWMNGVTMGAEDVSPKAANVIHASREANAHNVIRKGLLNAAPTQAQSEAASAWEARYADLRYFRSLGSMPDPSGKDLVLPRQAFPTVGPGQDVSSETRARVLAATSERGFGRKGIVKGAPIDASKLSAKDRIAMWEARKG